MKSRPQSPWECTSPSDYRYWKKNVADLFSANAITRYLLMVEIALIKVKVKRGMCDQSVLDEHIAAADQVKTEEVYRLEEDVTKHDIRALVEALQALMSELAGRYTHNPMTSYDVIDTALVLRLRETSANLIRPVLAKLILEIGEMAEKYADTPQVGRTHCQHAVPITWGFALTEYVHRLSDCYMSLRELEDQLVAKCSGPVGAYNALSMLVEDPRVFEVEVLAELGLEPAAHSTQIVPPEPNMRLLLEFVMIGGVLANLGDDLRNLQRTEIDEVREGTSEGQDGSSAMPHKKNPIGPENVKGSWKELVGQAVTVLMNQISDHQRDITNSLPARIYTVMIAQYVYHSISKMLTVMEGLVVNEERMLEVLGMTQGRIMTELFYILLAKYGHPDGHEAGKNLARKSDKLKRPFWELALESDELAEYVEQFSDEERVVFEHPETYTGAAAEVAREVCGTWEVILAEV